MTKYIVGFLVSIVAIASNAQTNSCSTSEGGYSYESATIVGDNTIISNPSLTVNSQKISMRTEDRAGVRICRIFGFTYGVISDSKFAKGAFIYFDGYNRPMMAESNQNTAVIKYLTCYN